MRAVTTIAITTILLATTAHADPFLKKAIEGNLAEVKMGELAQKNAQSQEVKAYGEMLVKDHGAANEKAIKLAKDLKISVPEAPTKQQKADHNELAKKTGAAFDKAFMQHMVKDHEKDIAAFQKGAKSKNQDIAKFAQDTLPTLKQHLKQAQALAK